MKHNSQGVICDHELVNAMSRGNRIVGHLTLAEVEGRLQRSSDPRLARRWQVVFLAMQKKMTTKEISREVGLAEQTIYNLISVYNRLGPFAYESWGHSRRRRAYLSLEEEREFLNRCIAKIAKGENLEVRGIQQELEKHLKHPVALSTVYRMLSRHNVGLNKE